VSPQGEDSIAERPNCPPAQGMRQGVLADSATFFARADGGGGATRTGRRGLTIAERHNWLRRYSVHQIHLKPMFALIIALVGAVAGAGITWWLGKTVTRITHDRIGIAARHQLENDSF
jgi:hypothetical protein